MNIRKSLKLIATIGVIFCLGVTNVSVKNAFSQTTPPLTQSHVSAQNMQDYAINLIATYNKTINDYFPDMKSSFYFYSASYNVATCISSQYGAAVWFEPSNATVFRNYNSSYRIEIAVFGGYPSSSGAAFGIGSGVVTISDSVSVNSNFIHLQDANSIAVIKNATVVLENSTQHYTYVVMKGSNETNSWTLDNAKNDAEEILYNDMHIEFSTSDQIKQRYAELELTQRLQQMETKFGDNSQTYPLSQWNADIQDLENLVTTKYHLGSPTGFLNDLILYLNARTGGNMPTIAPESTPSPTPTPYSPFPTVTSTPAPTSTPTTTLSVNQPDNWGYAIFCGFYPIIVFSVYSVLRRKIDDEDWKFFGNDQLIQGGLIGVGYAVLAVNFPYNSPHALFEILLSLLIAVCGSVTAIWIKKRILTPRPSRVNAAKRSDKKPNKTPEADKKVG